MHCTAPVLHRHSKTYIFLRHHFSYANFAQEIGQKKPKHGLKVGENCQNAQKNERKSRIFQFARTNFKTLRKVILILRHCTTMRR